MSDISSSPPQPSVSRRPFGAMPDGTVVDLITLDNGYIELSALTYGGIITSLRVPDRDGRRESVVLGFDRLEQYLVNDAYFGALVGRYANRIARGTFTLDGVTYHLPLNDGPNHLHGGPGGFSRRPWAATTERHDDEVAVVFQYESRAGEEGYPGTLRVDVSYRVTQDTVVLHYAAVADAPTIVNLTQHSYFNLAQPQSPTVLDHELCIVADAYTPVGPTLIPDGRFVSVAASAFDFRVPARIGDRLAAADPQLRAAGGFDHNYVLADRVRPLTLAATLRAPASGRKLELRTTEPGLQFYSGHLLDGRLSSAGRVFDTHAGLCLETQHFPDSPNQPNFPPVVLRPGERYRSTTTWRFGTA